MVACKRIYAVVPTNAGKRTYNRTYSHTTHRHRYRHRHMHTLGNERNKMNESRKKNSSIKQALPVHWFSCLQCGVVNKNSVYSFR